MSKIDKGNNEELVRLRQFYQKKLDDLQKAKEDDRRTLVKDKESAVEEIRKQNESQIKTAETEAKQNQEDLRDKFSRQSIDQQDKLYDKIKTMADAHFRENLENDAKNRLALSRNNEQWSENLKLQKDAGEHVLNETKDKFIHDKEQISKNYADNVDKQNSEFNDLLYRRNKEFNDKITNMKDGFSKTEKEERLKAARELETARVSAEERIKDLTNGYSQKEDFQHREKIKQQKLNEAMGTDDFSSKLKGISYNADRQVRAAEEKLNLGLQDKDREMGRLRDDNRINLENLKHETKVLRETEMARHGKEIEQKEASLKNDLNLTREEAARQARLMKESFEDSSAQQNVSNKEENVRRRDEYNQRLSGLENEFQNKLSHYINNQELGHQGEIQDLRNQNDQNWQLWQRRHDDQIKNFANTTKQMEDEKLKLADTFRDAYKQDVAKLKVGQDKEIEDINSFHNRSLKEELLKDKLARSQLEGTFKSQMESQSALSDLRHQQLADDFKVTRSEIEKQFNDTVSTMKKKQNEANLEKEAQHQLYVDELQRIFEQKVRDVSLGYEKKMATQRRENDMLVKNIESEYKKKLKNQEENTNAALALKDKEMKDAITRKDQQDKLVLDSTRQNYIDKIEQIKEDHLREMEKLTKA